MYSIAIILIEQRPFFQFEINAATPNRKKVKQKINKALALFLPKFLLFMLIAFVGCMQHCFLRMLTPYSLVKPKHIGVSIFGCYRNI